MYSSPVIMTDRLLLRKLEYEDLPALIKYADNQKVADKIVNIPHPFREPDAAFRLSYVLQGWKKKTGLPLPLF
jgi:ribosomal-protein-alanine N-acetyltransferase